MDFSGFLRQLLIRSGISQAALGRLCEVKGPHINMICQRKATPPLDKLEVMADALKLTGAERATFIQLGYLAHAPVEVQRLVKDLETRLARLEAAIPQLVAERDELREKINKFEQSRLHRK